MLFRSAGGVTLPARGWLGLTGARGLIQAVPAGDWVIETEYLWPNTAGVEWSGCGLAMFSSNNPASCVHAYIGGGCRNSAGHGRLNVTKFTNNSYTSNYIEVLSSSDNNQHLFFRIYKAGTTYGFRYSHNGTTFQFLYSTSSLGFTPAYFGLYNTSGTMCWFNYFRRIS